MSKIRDVFARNMKFYRLKSDLSQEKLAFMSGLHRTYVSSIECRARNISIDSIEKIARALDVLPSQLFMETTHE